MGKLILGAILAAIAVFGWEALSWTTIGWHQNGFRTFRDESTVSEVIKDGPYVYAIIRPGKGEISTGTNLTLSFIRCLICSFLIAALMSQVALFYAARIAFVAAAGLFAGLTADLPMWIWFEFPGRDAVVNIADHLIAWIIGGAVLGIFVGKDPVAEP